MLEFNDVVIKEAGQDRVQLEMNLEKLNIEKWNKNWKIETTVKYLATFQEISRQSFFLVCKTLYEIEKEWKSIIDENSVGNRGVKPTKWNSFLNALKEEKISPAKVERLISFYQSTMTEDTPIKILHDEIGYLPASYTSLNAIKEVNTETEQGKETIKEIITAYQDNPATTPAKIRKIIKNKKEIKKEKSSTIKPTFMIPNDSKKLKNLESVWKEVEKHTQVINSLFAKAGVADLEIRMENPAEKYEERYQIECSRASKKVERNIKKLIKSHQKIDSLESLINYEFEAETNKKIKKETLLSIEEYSLQELADNLLQAEYENYLKEAAKRNPQEVKQLANETASVLNTMITS